MKSRLSRKSGVPQWKLLATVLKHWSLLLTYQGYPPSPLPPPSLVAPVPLPGLLPRPPPVTSTPPCTSCYRTPGRDDRSLCPDIWSWSQSGNIRGFFLYSMLSYFQNIGCLLRMFNEENLHWPFYCHVTDQEIFNCALFIYLLSKQSLLWLTNRLKLLSSHTVYIIGINMVG